VSRLSFGLQLGEEGSRSGHESTVLRQFCEPCVWAAIERSERVKAHHVDCVWVDGSKQIEDAAVEEPAEVVGYLSQWFQFSGDTGDDGESMLRSDWGKGSGVPPSCFASA
jgi:hypothetical protein